MKSRKPDVHPLLPMLVIAVILTGIALWKLHAQNVAQDREIDNLREHVQSLLNQNPTRIVSRR